MKWDEPTVAHHFSRWELRDDDNRLVTIVDRNHEVRYSCCQPPRRWEWHDPKAGVYKPFPPSVRTLEQRLAYAALMVRMG